MGFCLQWRLGDPTGRGLAAETSTWEGLPPASVHPSVCQSVSWYVQLRQGIWDVLTIKERIAHVPRRELFLMFLRSWVAVIPFREDFFSEEHPEKEERFCNYTLQNTFGPKCVLHFWVELI